MKTILFFALSQVSSLFGHNHFLVHAVPKCGIHFIQKTIFEITGDSCVPASQVTPKILKKSQQENSIVCFHGPYSETQAQLLKNARLVSMIRDPRDALVSFIFHMRHFKGQGSHRDFFHVVPNFDDLSFDEQLLSTMTHPDPRFNCIEMYKDRVRWRTLPNACRVRYERLVGSKGGGDDTLQLVEVINICRFIGQFIDVETCRDISSKIYRQRAEEEADGKLFTHAQVGSWKHFFNDEHKKQAKKRLGELLIKLGYEEDLDW